METDNTNSDIILGLYIEIADADSSLAMPITLYVKGSIITGKLIGQKRYLELLGNGAVLQQFSTKLAEVESRFPEHIASEKDEYVHEYVHLDNAQILTSTGLLAPTDGVLWRGKIRAIDGYHFGNLATIFN